MKLLEGEQHSTTETNNYIMKYSQTPLNKAPNKKGGGEEGTKREDLPKSEPQKQTLKVGHYGT
jgi:hypothetical protein